MRGRPFQSGQSGNPGGRPRATGTFAKAVAEQTRDGQELIDFALSVLRNEAGDLKDRLRAMEFLAERMLGRPFSEVAIEHTDTQESRAAYDYSKLTTEELETMERLALKARVSWIASEGEE